MLNRLKITVQFARLGRLFLCLIIILAECVSAQKQVMPKLTTAMKSTILIGVALLFTGFPFGFLCNQRVTGLHSVSVVAK